MVEKIKQIIDASNRILIIQADNPDADSLASSLALESILGDMGKEPMMYCGVDMPNYLKYLSGWDRVSNEIPTSIDASIIVDTSSKTLLELLASNTNYNNVASRPTIVLDHHAGVECDIEYADVVINDDSKVSTGELIYSLSKDLGWDMSVESKEFIMTSILADSMGLASENTTANTYITMSELISSGISRPKLEEIRREYNKMDPSIFKYKAELINRTRLDNGLALVVIPQNEINEYSPLYNPAPLIQGDHLQTEGVKISVVIKNYDSGRITAAIRCNHSAPIAAELAKKFGGGGHAYAAGFKTTDKTIDTIKEEVISFVRELIDNGND